MSALIQQRSDDPLVKSLIISQFTSMLTLVETPLKAQGFKFVRLDGTMSLKRRSKAMEEFADTSPDSPTVFLLSLKAGGVGINLTAASRIFLLDPVITVKPHTFDWLQFCGFLWGGVSCTVLRLCSHHRQVFLC